MELLQCKILVSVMGVHVPTISEELVKTGLWSGFTLA